MHIFYLSSSLEPLQAVDFLPGFLPAEVCPVTGVTRISIQYKLKYAKMFNMSLLNYFFIIYLVLVFTYLEHAKLSILHKIQV